jgi:hypothetical protein
MKTALYALLLSCVAGVAAVGEKYDDFVARAGKGQQPDTRGEATMWLHQGQDGKGTLVVVVGGVIASEAYEALDFQAAKEIVAKQGNGAMFESNRLNSKVEWRTQDGNYRAIYRTDTKTLRLFFWPLYMEKVAKETEK